MVGWRECNASARGGCGGSFVTAGKVVEKQEEVSGPKIQTCDYESLGKVHYDSQGEEM